MVAGDGTQADAGVGGAEGDGREAIQDVKGTGGAQGALQRGGMEGTSEGDAGLARGEVATMEGAPEWRYGGDSEGTALLADGKEAAAAHMIVVIGRTGDGGVKDVSGGEALEEGSRGEHAEGTIGGLDAVGQAFEANHATSGAAPFGKVFADATIWKAGALAAGRSFVEPGGVGGW